ncbi:hypothetical protein PFISCL1PPCAC_19961 [Pristionchus fissidentatus]|uniref:Uncharacterized protein n=1 Tax=Pristionchus fissidentatus TaxID=1538716 RepID=A0AAV5WD53_9BILA|nr:hypothetical protein PFISCL1PPCAC_19961 [Pristionchus fissidentatus]
MCNVGMGVKQCSTIYVPLVSSYISQLLESYNQNLEFDGEEVSRKNDLPPISLKCTNNIIKSYETVKSPQEIIISIGLSLHSNKRFDTKTT